MREGELTNRERGRLRNANIGIECVWLHEWGEFRAIWTGIYGVNEQVIKGE